MKTLVKKLKKRDAKKVNLYRFENMNDNCNNSGAANTNKNCKCEGCK